MSTAQLIVSETSGRWWLALRTALLDSGVSLTEVADLVDSFGRLSDEPHAMLAFEASEARAIEGFRLLQSTRQRTPQRGVVVLLDGSLADSTPLWQEAGAIAVVLSPRHLALVARLILRYFGTRDAVANTFREGVWQRMPWNETKLPSGYSDKE